MGTLLIALAAIWSFLLIQSMDLGEFARLRNPMLVAIVVGAFLSWKYVEEFLAVRAMGMLALLAAEPLLEAAFMRHETSRLLLVVLAYVWIINGLFWVGMPWIMRDQIAWLTAKTAPLSDRSLGGTVLFGRSDLVRRFLLELRRAPAESRPRLGGDRLFRAVLFHKILHRVIQHGIKVML